MIIYIEVAATVYFLGWLYSFVMLRAIILDNFSELGWHLHRFTVFKRSVFWFLPGSIYYWKDAKWAKETDKYE